MVHTQFFKSFRVEVESCDFLFFEILRVFGQVFGANLFFAGKQGDEKMCSVRLKHFLDLQQPLCLSLKLLQQIVCEVFAIVIGTSLVVFFHSSRLKNPVVVGNDNALVFHHLGIMEKSPKVLVVESGQRLTKAIVLREIGFDF